MQSIQSRTRPQCGNLEERRRRHGHAQFTIPSEPRPDVHRSTGSLLNESMMHSMCTYLRRETSPRKKLRESSNQRALPAVQDVAVLLVARGRIHSSKKRKLLRPLQRIGSRRLRAGRARESGHFTPRTETSTSGTPIQQIQHLRDAVALRAAGCGPVGRSPRVPFPAPA